MEVHVSMCLFEKRFCRTIQESEITIAINSLMAAPEVAIHGVSK